MVPASHLRTEHHENPTNTQEEEVHVMRNQNYLDTEGTPESAERAGLRLVQDWVLLRDAGSWDEFESVWHDDGWMTATWFQGPFAEFVEASKQGWAKGVQIAHFLGGSTFQSRGDRMIGQTKMKIEQRTTVDGIEVDVTCSGRFFDFFERRDGVWGIVRRQPIYERDRLDVLDPGSQLKLDPARLAALPVGYRHLGYVQELVGYEVLRGLPGLRGAEVELLYSEGADWLDGAAEPGVPLGRHRG